MNQKETTLLPLHKLLQHASTFSFELAPDLDPIQVKRRENSHSQKENVWSVSFQGRVLNKEGLLEHEPLPSSRTDSFKKRTRFNLAEAFARAEELQMQFYESESFSDFLTKICKY